MKLRLIASFLILIVCACTSVSRWEPPLPKRKIASIDEVASLDPNKKTVCSITLNSSDEIEVTRQYLGEEHFNYIELVNTENRNWFKKACQSKVKCDILVISGHFGGVFFGKNGRLSLQELESEKCSNECDGILNHPKEVFLYGCNTLAGKTRDSRTPEQYRAVLLEDGFSPREADQIVALRYSPVGNSFNARMQRLFDQTPRIYGFDSIAPSGQNIRPYLKTYFSKRRGAKYASYLDKLSRSDKSLNRDFLRALYETNVAQSSGLITGEQPPRCMLESKSVGLDEKLAWIERVLNSDEDHLRYINEINSFLSTLSDVKLTERQRQVLERIRRNTTTEQRHRRAIEALRDYFFMQYELVNLAYQIGWYNHQEYRDYVIQTLLANPENIDLERRDALCSIPIEFDIEANELPEGAWNNPHFISSLECLKPTKESVHWKLLEVIKNKGEPAEHAALVFASLKPSRRIQIELAKALMDSEPEVAVAIAYSLEEMKSDVPEVHQVLLNCIKEHESSDTREACSNSLAQIAPRNLKFGREILEALRTHPNPSSVNETSKLIVMAAEISKRSPELLESLARLALDPKYQNSRVNICLALANQRVNDARIWRTLSQAVLNFADEALIGFCAAALGRMGAKDDQVLLNLAEAARKTRNSDTRETIQSAIRTIERLNSLPL